MNVETEWRKVTKPTSLTVAAVVLVLVVAVIVVVVAVVVVVVIIIIVVVVLVAVVVLVVLDNSIIGIITYVSQDSRICIATSYWLNCPGFEYPLRKGRTLFTQTFRLSLGPTQPYLHWVPGFYSQQ